MDGVTAAAVTDAVTGSQREKIMGLANAEQARGAASEVPSCFKGHSSSSDTEGSQDSQSRAVQATVAPPLKHSSSMSALRIPVPPLQAKQEGDKDRNLNARATPRVEDAPVGTNVHVRVAGRLVAGIVRYVGALDLAAGHWFGVELEEPVGRNDGTVRRRCYFRCPPRHGVFTRRGGIITSNENDVNAVRPSLVAAASFRSASNTCTLRKKPGCELRSAIHQGEEGETAAVELQQCLAKLRLSEHGKSFASEEVAALRSTLSCAIAAHESRETAWEEEISSLRSCMQASLERTVELDDQLQIVRDQVVSEAESSRTVKAEIDDLRAAELTASQCSVELQTEIGELQLELKESHRKQTELTVSRSPENAMHAEIQGLQTELTASLETRLELAAQVKDLQLDLATKHGSIASSESEVQRLRSELVAHLDPRRELEAKVQSLQMELDEKRDQQDEREAQIHLLRAELIASHDPQIRLEAQVEELLTELSTSISLRSERESEMLALRAELKASCEPRAELQSQVDGLQAEVVVHRGSQEVLETHIRELQAELSDCSVLQVELEARSETSREDLLAMIEGLQQAARVTQENVVAEQQTLGHTLEESRALGEARHEAALARDEARKLKARLDLEESKKPALEESVMLRKAEEDAAHAREEQNNFKAHLNQQEVNGKHQQKSPARDSIADDSIVDCKRSRLPDNDDGCLNIDIFSLSWILCSTRQTMESQQQKLRQSFGNSVARKCRTSSDDNGTYTSPRKGDMDADAVRPSPAQATRASNRTTPPPTLHREAERQPTLGSGASSTRFQRNLIRSKILCQNYSTCKSAVQAATA
eukprot:TRINITY_DN67359_c0_g1_i1.p1 TRINITY_DN67359_c0_g1~~TRINITY_DN67359_c0_g1_i1.p1  ORF type:complete len:827 (+),score=148.85 TRINITY_DN67359_c0_g1_i1:79-2559(+)